FQHGDWPRHRAGVHIPAQFPHALHVAFDHRVLAALAHVAVVVAARLSLHSARRQPRKRCADVPQSHHGVPALRALARSELDVRPVGRLARLVWGPPPARLARPARWAYALLVVMGGWVLFRSTNLPEAIGYYASLF